MSDRTRRALKVLEAALLLGILGDGLLRAPQPGLNVLLWAGALLIALAALMGRSKRVRALAGGGHLLLLSAVLFAAAFAWRDSPTLNWLAGLGLFVSLTLAAWRARGGRLRLAGLGEYALGIMAACADALFAGFSLLLGRDVQWKELPLGGWSRHLKAVAFGLVLAVPLLLLFGALFVAADARFERAVSSILRVNGEEVVGHVFLALGMAWAAGGFMRGVILGNEVEVTSEGRAVFAPAERPAGCAADTVAGMWPAKKPEPVRLGVVEMGVALGLLNLLFLSFVLFQLRYLFGGASLVQAPGGLTFSEYYRRGFFELVTVAALVLPILLAAHWLLRKGNPAHERIFRALAGTTVLLLFVIMASATRRMLLYQGEYGLTELRLYTTAFMGWLFLVFVWFAATVLRGRREQFACGALAAGLLVAAALHVINPDAFIVRVNMAHARAGRGFDAQYASSLSADAVPELLEALPAMYPEDRRLVALTVLERLEAQEGADWRSWNWSRSQAASAVRERYEELGSLSAPLPSLTPVEVGTRAGGGWGVGHAGRPNTSAGVDENLIRALKGDNAPSRPGPRRVRVYSRRRVSRG